MDPLTEIRVSPAPITDIYCHNGCGHHQVGHDVSLKTLCRSADPDTPTLWYAQDAAGAIWKVDITASHTVSHLTCHLSEVSRLCPYSVSLQRNWSAITVALCVASAALLLDIRLPPLDMMVTSTHHTLPSHTPTVIAGSVRVYDLATRELLCHTHLSGGGASLMWAPPTVESPSTTLLAGFRDGVMRCEL